jgi:hypothetical protein
MSDDIMKFNNKLLAQTWNLAKRNKAASPPTAFFRMLSEGLPDLSGEDYQQVALFLSVWVNTITDEVKAVAPLLQTFVNAKIEDIKTATQSDKDGVGEFLVESLRCVNFAYHNSDYVAEFIVLIKACGISIEGEPEQCTEHATFGVLQYNDKTHLVVMHP